MELEDRIAIDDAGAEAAHPRNEEQIGDSDVTGPHGPKPVKQKQTGHSSVAGPKPVKQKQKQVEKDGEWIYNKRKTKLILKD